jgi:hypothetical protein
MIIFIFKKNCLKIYLNNFFCFFKKIDNTSQQFKIINQKNQKSKKLKIKNS